MYFDNLRKNVEGYDDPTPYKAVKRMQTEDDVRFYKLLHTIFHVCELAGFEVKGRVVLKDRKTGKIYD